MANISFLASATATSNAAATLAVTAPSGTTIGDLVVVLATRNAPGGITDTVSDNNAGHAFTKDRTDWESSNGLTLVIFSRRIVSGDPGSYSFTFAGDLGPTRFTIYALTFRNPDATSIYDVTPSAATESHKNPDAATVNTVSVASTRAGCIHVICATREGGTGYFDSTPTGYTKEAAGGNALNTVWYKVLGAAGATAAQTVTASGGGSGATQTQSFIIMNSPAPANFPITATVGSLLLAGVDVVFRLGSFTYLRYKK